MRTAHEVEDQFFRFVRAGGDVEAWSELTRGLSLVQRATYADIVDLYVTGRIRPEGLGAGMAARLFPKGLREVRARLS